MAGLSKIYNNFFRNNKYKINLLLLIMLKMQPLLKSKNGIAESYLFPTVILPLDEVIDLMVHHLKLEQQRIKHTYDKY